MQAALFEKGYVTQSEISLRIEKLAGRPYAQLTRRELEILSRHVFVEYVSSHPFRFMCGLAQNAARYVLWPPESCVRVAAGWTSFNLLRPGEIVGGARGQPEHLVLNRIPIHKLVLGLLLLACIPIWIIALWPGMARMPKTSNLYLFALVIIFFFIGLASPFSGAGERYRFPALPLLLVCFACNLDSLVSWGNSRSVRLGRTRLP